MLPTTPRALRAQTYPRAKMSTILAHPNLAPSGLLLLLIEAEEEASNDN